MELPPCTDTEDTARNIATLAREMHLTEAEVGAVYHSALDKLAATARIRSYLGILAMNSTRSILEARPGTSVMH